MKKLFPILLLMVLTARNQIVKKTVQRVSPPSGEDWVLMIQGD